MADEAVIIECEIRGTHLGWWRGLPPTGRRVRFPLCAVYTFAEGDKLAGERIYYDRTTVLRQLGVLHDPESPLGRALTPITHPITLGCALFRWIRVRRRHYGAGLKQIYERLEGASPWR